MKKLLIAGATSGSGKTSVTLAILAALHKQYRIQPYKVGPDYVDTKFHSRITGRQSRNIDSFLVPDPQTLRQLFARDTGDVDLGLIEGVMGLYDGLGTDKDAHSTASIAKQLDVPVILVVNARSASTSVAAIVKGFMTFDPAVPIAGVVVNNVMSENHYQLIKGAIDRYVGLPVLGYLPFKKELALPSRQLGLVPDNELPEIDSKIAALGELATKHLDLNRLLALAGMSTTIENPQPLARQRVQLRLGIAQDDAFSFYYQDNLTALREAGVTLIPFSPIHDAKLPDVDALYLGGGYPEEFAEQLAANGTMKQSIRTFSEADKPIYAECGGLMYLGQKLITADGTFDMVGIFNGDSQMTPRLKRFGYCQATPRTTTVLGDAGTVIYGHEFHHSVFTTHDTQLKPVLEMEKVRDGQTVATWTGGYQVRRTFASYLHVHFYQSQALFERLLQQLGAVRDATD
ncbi:cobyrinate a,c-diamide synthase [Secundilactobacillus muriivasis]